MSIIRNLLSLTLIATTIYAAKPVYTPANITLFVQGYNVLYTNNKMRIGLECSRFAAANPTLLLLLCNPKFVSAALANLRRGASIADFYPIFDAFDATGRLKAFAHKLMTQGKDAIEDGIQAIQSVLDAGYSIVILTGHDEEFNASFKHMFPILQHERITIVNSYKASVDAYHVLHKAYGKEHAIFICGNRNHISVDQAEKAKFTVLHYSDVSAQFAL